MNDAEKAVVQARTGICCDCYCECCPTCGECITCQGHRADCNRDPFYRPKAPPKTKEAKP